MAWKCTGYISASDIKQLKALIAGKLALWNYF